MKELVFFRLEKKNLRRDLVTVFKFLKLVYKKDGNQLLAVVKGLKLWKRNFSLEIRMNFLTARVVKHWNKLPCMVVKSPSL